jgi:hypothetical protein
VQEQELSLAEVLAQGLEEEQAEALFLLVFQEQLRQELRANQVEGQQQVQALELGQQLGLEEERLNQAQQQALVEGQVDYLEWKVD